MSSENLERLLAAIKSAKSDNEKLAALLMVARCIKVEELDSESRHRVFSTIGFNFISRLISTKIKPVDENVILFRSIGISVLSTFCTDKEMVTCPEMLRNLPLLGELVASTSEGVSDEEKRTVDDSYDCLTCIADHAAGRKALSEANTVSSLLTAATNHCYGYEKALKLLSLLARFHDNSYKLQECDGESFLIALIKDFCTIKNEEKFLIGTTLADFISAYCITDVLHKVSGGEFWKPLCTTMWEILSSRIYEAQRSTVLALISELAKVYGLKWFLTQGVSSRQLLLLLRLVCVEIQMILDECDVREVVMEKQLTVMSCCVILEDIQNVLDIDEILDLDMTQLEQIGGSVMSAIRSILAFIQYQYNTHIACASDDDDIMGKMRPVFCACIRLIGSWASDEECAVNKEFTDCLSAIICICEKLCGQYSIVAPELLAADESARNLKSDTAPASKPKTVSFHTHEELASGVERSSTESVDLLSFILPALVHSTTLSSLRCDLSCSAIVPLLVNYLSWKLSIRKKSTPSSVDEEISQACAVINNYLNDASLKPDLHFNQLIQPLLCALSLQDDHDIPAEVLTHIEDIFCADDITCEETRNKLLQVSRSHDMLRLQHILKKK